MSATFATPMAAVLLAVELLLFEWKPRSLIPVALASAVAAACAAATCSAPGRSSRCRRIAICHRSGRLSRLRRRRAAGGGAVGAVLTVAVYAAEDAFQRLPIHWMWWPAIGGLVIGIGGLIFPQALGVGYDIIDGAAPGRRPAADHPRRARRQVHHLGVSLGSGTSGGVLAPLLMMGGALGGAEAMVFPDQGSGSGRW